MKGKSAVSYLLVGALLAGLAPAAGARVTRHGNRRDTVIIRDRHDHHHNNVGAAIVGGIVTGVVAGAVAGSVAGAAARPRPPQTVVVPVAVPAYAPGTVVSALPGGCATVVVGAVTYFNCVGVYYMPVMMGGALGYQVVLPPR